LSKVFLLHHACSLTGGLPLAMFSRGLDRLGNSWAGAFSFTRVCLVFLCLVILILIHRIWSLKTCEREYEELAKRSATREAAHERRYRELLDNSSDIVYTHDRTGNLITWSKAGELITGYTQRDLSGKNLADLVPAPEQEAVRRLLRELGEGSAPDTFELIVVAKCGSRIVLDVSTRQITREGQLAGILGFARDVTARKRAEEALSRSELRLRTVVTNAPVILLAFDGEGKVTFCEGMSLQSLGIEAGSMTGRSVEDVDAYLPGLARACARARSGETVNSVFETGGAVYETRLVPLRSQEGRITGLIGIATEITALKRSEEEAQRARQAAEAASKAKSEFLANMSHEIRTPLNCIIGMTELALDTPLNSEQHEYLDLVRTSANSLLGIINDILDFSKVEAGKFELDLDRFNLFEVVKGTARLLEVRARQKGLELRTEIVPGTASSLLGDAGRLRQVLTNLVGNAIKFTERGAVTVRVTPEVQTQNEAILRFEVIDTGIGIPPEKQRAIFEAFAQADGSTTRRYGGTGLGLTISRQLIEMMNGHLDVESEPGRGSTFRFTLRLPRMHEAPHREEVAEQVSSAIPTPSVAPTSSRRVLLAEDNPANQKLARYILEKQGFEVQVASNGREALALFETAGPAAFDLVLMDLQMPQMSGLEAAAAIRSRETSSGPRLPIVALTAHALKEDLERCLAAGMDAYISKPIHREELLRTIENFCRRSASCPDTSPLPLSASTDVLDMAHTLDRACGDPGLLRELAEIFLRTFRALLDDGRLALGRHDAPSLERAVHALKSSLSNFTARAALRAVGILDEKMRQQNEVEIENALDALEGEVERLVPALQALAQTVPSCAVEEAHVADEVSTLA
jgi:PAS domain S-box-containing protein